MPSTRTLSLATAACAAAAACYFYRRRRAATIAPRVLVASTSLAKLAAVKAALGAREVTSLPAPSLVEDQPIGTDRTMKGVSNRLKSITAAAAEGYDYAVAIESGLVRLHLSGTGGPPERWLETAVVVVLNLRTGASSVASSPGLEFPSSFVGEWVEDGQEGTVGAIIGQQTGCDKEDPHAHLSGGAFPRSALLESALRLAIATMPLGPQAEAPDPEGE